MSRKTRVLMVGEASFLATGYSTYAKEVMQHLHASGKFELAELACYGGSDDSRRLDIPWGYLANLPSPGQEAEYQSNKLNEFGEWRFEDACLSFKPDIVWSFRDWWMDEFIERSPFRPFFHWAHMPTVDAEPLDDQWLATYQGVDSLFAYTDWGVDVLRKYGLPAIQSAPPGADFRTFTSLPQRMQFRQGMGLRPDALVIGTVMRNQRRKLYSDLIDAFALYLKTAPAYMAERSFLYLHCAFPDIGWNIPRLLKEAGIGNKTLMTYHCEICDSAYPSFYADPRAACRRCGNNTAKLVDPNRGISRDNLAHTLNMMDVYVQYATCEGFGMPQVEAAACGVPVAAVDYSAMCDVVRKLKGRPIRVERFVREADTHRLLALPDNKDLVNYLIEILDKPQPVRARLGQASREAAMCHYDYAKTARIWEQHFETIQQKPWKETWASPPRFHTPAMNVPINLPDDQFVRWCICHVAGRPDLADSYMAVRLARDLSWGTTSGGMGGLAFNDFSAIGIDIEKKMFGFTKDDVLKNLAHICERQNNWERKRTGVDQ